MAEIEMQENYLDIMQRSLEKKIQVLNRIIELDKEQKKVLEDTESEPDRFDELVEAKEQQIEQLEQLDSGFEKLFANVKEQLNGNKEKYASQIKNMQELIKTITDKSVEIQAQEARNKELMTKKFAEVRQQAKTVRTSNKVATEYYRTMAKLNHVDPQFYDNKH